MFDVGGRTQGRSAGVIFTVLRKSLLGLVLKEASGGRRAWELL